MNTSTGIADPLVSVVTKAPRKVRFGTGFVVSLTINKGSLGGFARVLQTLPPGYKAEPLDTWGARFQQTGQDIKFIWLELPAQPSFIISYRVNPENETNEPFTVSGSFSYLKDNKNVKLPIASTEVTVGGPDETVQEDANQPLVTRKLLTSKPEEGEYIVELSILPTVETENARFIDYIPAGYVSKPLQVGDARFTSENGRANFYWDRLKANESTVVTYIIRSGRPEDQAPKIQGLMLYGDEATGSLLAEKPSLDKNDDNPSSSEFLEAPVTDPASAVVPANIQAPSNPDNVKSIRSQSATPADKGIRFKVQLVATKRSPVRNQAWFRTNMGNVGNVEFYQLEGWNKYQIGAYLTFEEAKSAQQKARTFADDAFIV
ncbi:MAG: hypothetical protein ACKOKF_01350, partial [Bacteroidota bacterium]